MFLLAAKTNKTEDNSGIIEYYFKDVLSKFKETNLITFVKAKNKSENEYNTVRLSSVGNDWVDDFTMPEVTEGDLQMFNYLKNIYLSHEDKERVVGNSKKIKIYCAVLRNHLDMTLHEFYFFIELYLSEAIFTKKLENLFLDSNKVRYGSFINNISESPLYQFWELKENEIRSYWSKKIKKEE
jgi:hypothetical protein